MDFINTWRDKKEKKRKKKSGGKPRLEFQLNKARSISIN
jgi:hypothetical protein